MRGDNPFTHRIPVKDRDGRVIGEKEVVAYRGLLDMVHRDGLKEIRTRLVQVPTKENGQTAIVHATIFTQKGRFTGIGDANPGNVNARIAPHVIRMAETRAEARAMRKAVNIGVVALEELGEDLDSDQTYDGAMVAPTNVHSRTEPTPPPPSPAPQPPPPPEPPPAAQPAARINATEEQRRYLYRLLSERGIHGDQAREYLQKELGVASVKDASRTAVSALIDRIKNGSGNGKNATNGGAGP